MGRHAVLLPRRRGPIGDAWREDGGDWAKGLTTAYKLAAVGAGAQTVGEEAEMAKEFSRLIYMRKRWRDVRKEALRRDQYTCQSCGARAEEVHHLIPITPETVADDKIVYGLDNLQSLCFRCHQMETRGSTETADGFVFDENGQLVRI